MSDNSSKSIGKKTVMTALFAALISAGCFIHIPLPGGVPITVQDMMALLSGLLLGPVYGTAGLILYFALDACAHKRRAFVSGKDEQTSVPPKKNGAAEIMSIVTAAFSATVILFALGIARFCFLLPNKTFREVLFITLIPFIPGNLIKIAIMTLLTKKLRPVLQNYFG